MREQSVGPTCSHTCHQTQHQCEVKGQVLVGAIPERRDRRSVEIVCQRCCGNGDCRCTRRSRPIWVACLWPSLCLWVVTDEVRRADYTVRTAHHPRVPLLLLQVLCAEIPGALNGRIVGTIPHPEDRSSTKRGSHNDPENPAQIVVAIRVEVPDLPARNPV